MCRLVAYLGESVILDEVLFQPDSSIVEQAVHPQLLSAMNLAGFGAVAWDDDSRSPDLPWTYRTAGLPFFDRNLRALSRKARATALLGHVRGVLLSDREVVNEQNVHPFRYEGTPIALAMNGDLDRFAEMRVDVANLVEPGIAKLVEGTTDSECECERLIKIFQSFIQHLFFYECLPAVVIGECQFRVQANRLIKIFESLIDQTFSKIGHTAIREKICLCRHQDDRLVLVFQCPIEIADS